MVDEAAHVNKEIYYELLDPCLTDHDGWVILASTPLGFNWYHDLYSQVKSLPDWFIYECPSWASPMMPRDKLELKKQYMSEATWNQEYGGQFTSHGDAIFRPIWFSDPSTGWEILTKEFPKSFRRGFVACDTSMGQLYSDYQSICFLGELENKLWCDCIITRVSIEEYLQNIRMMYDRYQPEGIAIESGGMQGVVAQQLQRLFQGTNVPIYDITQKIDKITRISRLSDPLSRNQIKILDNLSGKLMVNQLRDFPSKTGKVDGPDSLEFCWRCMYSDLLTGYN